MVRRLVQHQEIGLRHQQPRQVRPHHPATAQLPRRPIVIRLPKRQPRQDPLGPRNGLAIHVVRMAVIQRCLRARRSRRRHTMSQRQVQHRLVPGRRTFLRQDPHPHAAHEGNVAFVGLLLAQQDPKQRGLPGAIRPHKTDTVPGHQGQGSVGE